MLEKRGQIWVETVIYTLIGLSLIGLVLAILTPQIKSYRDRNLIEQTIDSLTLIDAKIREVLDAPGNKRKVEFSLAKGYFFIDVVDNKLRWEFEDSNVEYSESGIDINIGRIIVRTDEASKGYKVTLEAPYSYDITYKDSNTDEKQFGPTSIPYKIFIENKGLNSDGDIIVDISDG